MPLVIFNYNRNTDGAIPDNGEFRFVQELPSWAQDKKWTLRAVNALYYPDDNNPGDFRFVDIKIPELMNRDSVLYSGVGMGEDGGVPVNPPQEFFRFFCKNYQLSQKSFDTPGELYHEYPAFAAVSEYPDWDLGTHHLEQEHLTFIIKSGFGNVKDSAKTIESASIILSFEE